MNVCLGGTFHPLHKGHKELIRKAVRTAGPTGTIFIGITSKKMIKQKGKIASFQSRKHAIEEFLKEEQVHQQVIIRQLTDKYGPTLQGMFDAIIVSPETKSTAEDINRKRIQRGNEPLQISIIPYILAQDGKPISSTRIRKNEIDENGTLIKQE